MKRGLLLVLALVLAAPVRADDTSFDIAPTTLDLKAGEAGLFYVTNHSAQPVTIQIEALDWSQQNGADTLSPSRTLFTSPPIARITPGTRQSVRVLARPAGDGPAAYRLRVSELPDAGRDSNGVKVLLQFSVPVFVGHDPRRAPELVWHAAGTPGGARISVHNQGRQTVKLTGLKLNGASLDGGAFSYVLPGATRMFQAPPVQGPLHLTGHDARSGRDMALDLTPGGAPPL